MRKRNRKIIIMLLIILVLPMFIHWVVGSTAETISITFNDKNLYSSIKDKISDKIDGSDSNTNTLKIKTQVIPSIESLNLSNCSIRDLSGIENFTRVNRIIFIIKSDYRYF